MTKNIRTWAWVFLNNDAQEQIPSLARLLGCLVPDTRVGPLTFRRRYLPVQALHRHPLAQIPEMGTTLRTTCDRFAHYRRGRVQ
jgi:hypothetical protein